MLLFSLANLDNEWFTRVLMALNKRQTAQAPPVGKEISQCQLSIIGCIYSQEIMLNIRIHVNDLMANQEIFLALLQFEITASPLGFRF